MRMLAWAERAGIIEPAKEPTTSERRVDWAEAIRAPIKEHGRAWAMVNDEHPGVVCCANRRAAKTESPGREALARMVERDGYIVWAVTLTQRQYSKNWLERHQGALDILDDLGVPYTVKRGSEGGVVEIRFPWGSMLRVVSVPHRKKIGDARGGRFHRCIVDEAQEIPYLEEVLADLLIPAAQDFRGQICLTGTPGDELGSTFERLSNGADDDWHVHKFFTWDNPLFDDDRGEGCEYPEGSFERRYHLSTARTCRKNRRIYRLSHAQVEMIEALKRDEAENILEYLEGQPEHLRSLPDRVLKELFGTWVANPDLLVFPTAGCDEMYWDAVWSPTETAWCVSQTKEHGWETVNTWRSLMDGLPPYRNGNIVRPQRWYGGVGCDLGFKPDPFALVAMVWSSAGIVYELDSFKCTELGDEEQFALLRRWVMTLRELAEAGLKGVVVDASGPAASMGEGWRRKLAPHLPPGIYTASPEKEDKFGQITAWNIDTNQGRILLRENSPMDVERRHLRWTPYDAARPGKRRVVDDKRQVSLADGSHCRPGDHVMDGGRYVWWFAGPWKDREKQPPRTVEEQLQYDIDREFMQNRTGRQSRQVRELRRRHRRVRN